MEFTPVATQMSLEEVCDLRRKCCRVGGKSSMSALVGLSSMVLWRSPVAVLSCAGNHTRANTEDLLIATCGAGLERASASIKQVVYSCLGEHSEKPWEVRRRLELLYGDVSRVELFARESWTGWDRWGNQCESSVEMHSGRFITREGI